MTTLGRVYRDRISGFVGTAVGRAEYLYDSPSVQLVANTGPTGDGKTRWIEEARLEEHADQAAGFTADG